MPCWYEHDTHYWILPMFNRHNAMQGQAKIYSKLNCWLFWKWYNAKPNQVTKPNLLMLGKNLSQQMFCKTKFECFKFNSVLFFTLLLLYRPFQKHSIVPILKMSWGICNFAQTRPLFKAKMAERVLLNV